MIYLYTLLLLLSCFSRVQLCATPQTTAHQAPLSLGFSKQEHWNGLPFPSPAHESEKWKWSHVRLLATPWTAAHQAPPSTGFSRQECWSGVPLPSPYPYIYIFCYIYITKFHFIIDRNGNAIEHLFLMEKKKRKAGGVWGGATLGDFPDRHVVKTLNFHCSSIPGPLVRELRYLMTYRSAKKFKKWKIIKK